MTPLTLAPTASAQDTVLRLALGMFAADPFSPLTAPQRQWVVTRLQTTAALTPHERAALRAPLLAWVGERHPRILAIVTRQFDPDAPPEETAARRDPGHDILDGLIVAARGAGAASISGAGDQRM
jgi:hypothetical protein